MQQMGSAYRHGEEVKGNIKADDGDFGSIILVRNAIQIFENGSRSCGHHTYMRKCWYM
jgi:hypothetical protein